MTDTTTDERGATLAAVIEAAGDAEILAVDFQTTALHLTMRHPQASAAHIALALSHLQPRVQARDRDTFDVTVPTARGNEGAKQVAVRLPTALAAAVRARREADGTSVTAQIWQAYEAHRDQLEAHFVTRRAALGLPPSAARRRRGTGPTTQVWLYLNDAERANFDELARRWCAGNRSALATALLAAQADQQEHTLTTH